MDGLPLPPHFDPVRVGEVWRVPYAERAREAPDWAERHAIRPTREDAFRLGLVIVDAQNTFCIPDFELFVAGRSGTGAVDDNRRLCAFIYRNLAAITQIFPSLDTHDAMQIFHPIWLVDERGEHPDAYTLISAEDVEAGRWRVNEAAVEAVGIDAGYAARHLAHYTRRLAAGGKYDLTIWPYHAMLGGIGHALVSAVEEAVFFHGVARHSRPEFQVKGNHPLTEHYSIFGPEVTVGPDGDSLGVPASELAGRLAAFDAVVIAGQAKSHCLAWTIDDLLEARAQHGGGPAADRTYLLEDCTSPVVVPGVIDYTDPANAAFDRYVDAGMHVVRSTDPLESWPGLADIPEP